MICSQCDPWIGTLHCIVSFPYPPIRIRIVSVGARSLGLKTKRNLIKKTRVVPWVVKTPLSLGRQYEHVSVFCGLDREESTTCIMSVHMRRLPDPHGSDYRHSDRCWNNTDDIYMCVLIRKERKRRKSGFEVYMYMGTYELNSLSGKQYIWYLRVHTQK
jgi:hypothetical protein